MRQSLTLFTIYDSNYMCAKLSINNMYKSRNDLQGYIYSKNDGCHWTHKRKQNTQKKN